MEDVGETAAHAKDTSMDSLCRAMEELTLTPRSWSERGNWLYIWEYNERFKDWVPVNVQTTDMGLSKRIPLLLSASFNSKQPQYNTAFSRFLRATHPDRWRVRIIAERFWVDDDGKKLTLDEALKFFTLKYKTYECQDNPIGLNVTNSPKHSPPQREKAKSVVPCPRFTSFDTPSKRGDRSPSPTKKSPKKK